MATFTKFSIFVQDVGRKVHNLHTDVLKVALTNSAPLAITKCRAAHPWLTKAMGRWNPNDHPRGQPENAGEFTSGGGSGAPSTVSRDNPDLDAAMGAAPTQPKPPAANIRSNGPDIFDPQEAAPVRHPSAHNPDVTYGHADDRDSDDKHFALLMRQAARNVAAAKRKLAQKVASNPTDTPAIRVLRAKLDQQTAKVAALKAKAERVKPDPKQVRADRMGATGNRIRGQQHAGTGPSGDTAARPAPIPLERAGDSPSPTAPQGAPQRSQGPAGGHAATPPELPHERTMQTANAAANMLAHLPPGAPPDVRRVAHQQAVAALDAHLKAGLAELKRRASKAGFRGGNMYRKAKAAFTAKLSAARQRIDEMAGRGPPPVPGQGSQRGHAPPVASRRAAPPPLPGRRPPPLPPTSGRQLAPWVPLKACHPWLVKGWVTIGGKKDEDGEHAGGTHVFIEGGKITRGPKHMIGRAPNDLKGSRPNRGGKPVPAKEAKPNPKPGSAELHERQAGIDLSRLPPGARVEIQDSKERVPHGGAFDMYQPAGKQAVLHVDKNKLTTEQRKYVESLGYKTWGSDNRYLGEVSSSDERTSPEEWRRAYAKKQPHERTREEVESDAVHRLTPAKAGQFSPTRDQYEAAVRQAAAGHETSVRMAMATGKKVPAHVLADYPHLTVKSWDLSLPPRHPWLVKTHDVSHEARDDKGRWAAGGNSTAHRLRSAIAHVSTYSEDDISHHYGLADRAVAELKALPQPDIYRHLKAAGLEGIKPGDSKKALLIRLHNRITAGVRARLRNEV